MILRSLVVFFSVLLFNLPALADTVRLADGTSCSFDADDSNTELTVGVGRDRSDNIQHTSDLYNVDQRDTNDAFSVSLTYRFGTPERLDCKALYDMELERRSLELEIMKKKLKIMEQARDIEW